jgi:C4-type Zn-finger protein
MGYSKAEVQDIIGLVESIKEKLKVEDEEDKQKIDSTLEFWQEAYKNL